MALGGIDLEKAEEKSFRARMEVMAFDESRALATL